MIPTGKVDGMKEEGRRKKKIKENKIEL